MEQNRQVSLKQSKIPIGRKNGHLVVRRYRANEKIGIRSLDSLAATKVEEFGGILEIAGRKFKIYEWSQVIA